MVDPLRRSWTGVSFRWRPFTLVLAGAALLALVFLLLPILAIFLEIAPAEIGRQLGTDFVVDALIVTARANGIAFAVTLLVGTPAGYFLATRRFPGRTLLITLCELPLVLPPVVAGIGLLAAFGRVGLLGGTFDALGISIGFTNLAVTFAVLLVAGPYYLRQAIAAFEAVDPNLVAAARTLGAGPGRAFRRVALPLAMTGLSAGAALAFARGIGEFGATLMFAGSFQGETQTFTLAIYQAFDVDFDLALALGALLVLVSAAILLGVKLLGSWRSAPALGGVRGR
ncbi:MAG: molybdate ABC transporter permease subunit [Thermoleophilia bacterium]